MKKGLKNIYRNVYIFLSKIWHIKKYMLKYPCIYHLTNYKYANKYK